MSDTIKFLQDLVYKFNLLEERVRELEEEIPKIHSDLSDLDAR